MKLLLLTLVFLNVGGTQPESLECPVNEVTVGTIVTLMLDHLVVNKSYGVIVLESKRVLIDWNNTEGYERYVFSMVFKQTDVDQQDYIRLQLLRIEGEEWIIMDELYLQVVYPGGMPLELLVICLVVALVTVVICFGYLISDIRY